MGAGGFHGRVRDGIGCGPPAMAARSSGIFPGLVHSFMCDGSVVCRVVGRRNCCRAWRPDHQAYRAIRTGQLRALPHVHTRPIDVMVCHGPRGDLVLRWVSRLDAFSGYPVRT